MTDESAASPNRFEKDKPGTSARTAAEEAIERLRREGGIFVDAVAATRMPMALTDARLPGNPIVFANQAFLELSGYSIDEVLGQQPHFMDGPATDPEDAARFREALAKGEDILIEAVQYRKDGSRFWSAVFCRPLQDEAGAVKNHFLSYLDISRRVEAEAQVREQVVERVRWEAEAKVREQATERLRAQEEAKAREEAAKRAEAALWESEERYRLIVENAKDYAIIVSDPNDIIVEWMPGAEAVFGWSREEAIGRPAAITFTPSDRADGQPEKEIETAVREGFAPDVRWHERKDGSLVFIEGAVTPLRNEKGGIRAFLKIGQDVTERRSAQEALAASEARMRSLVTGIPQMVFRSWGSGERIWGSPQWIEYTGLSFEESLGFGWLDALHPDDRKGSMDAWREAEARGEYYIEHRILNDATGEYRWHQTRAIPASDESGRVLEWLGTSTDVEELRRLQRHQQTLLGELQHRVRNTLGVIRSIARRTAATSENVEEMAMHLEGRIGAFSRVQAVVTRSPESGVDLAAMIEDELLAHAAREGEALTIEGPDVSLKPRAAETISLAIHELATNAVKYGALGSDRGLIAVRWERARPDGAELLNLVWEENGVDRVPAAPERQGFGLELLQRTLPYELGAETRVEFRPEGVRFSLSMPLGAAVLEDVPTAAGPIASA
jgi:PAS domain S-box-containing protein